MRSKLILILIASILGSGLFASVGAAATNYETEVLYGVNFRSQPSTSSKVIRMLKKGEAIHVKEKLGNWLKVETKDGKTGYISSNKKYTNYSSSGSSAAGSTSKSRSAVVAKAKSYKGDFKYKWGAEPWTTNNKYTDCSALMQLIFRQFGIDLPRTSREQAKVGKSVKKSELKQGDLVFFDTTGNGKINHVGIYIGNNEFLHASPIFKDGVGISKLNSSYWSKHYETARSVL